MALVRLTRPALATLALAGCRPLPPPPAVPLHAGTAPSERGTTTAMLVVGTAGQLFSLGLGAAVRVEHQQTDATTVGLEVAAGRGDAEAGRAWLLAARGYGRTAYTDGGYLAVTWGGGVSILTSGLVTVGGHAGAAASYPDDWATPYLSAGLALAAPLRQGWPRPLPTPTCADCDAASAVQSSDVRADLFVYADLGLVSALGGDAPRLSVDLGVASPVRAYGAGLLALSVGAGAADR